jgi:hypothetical protein
MSWREINKERKKERKNNNKFRGHCISLLQSTACTATLGPMSKYVNKVKSINTLGQIAFNIFIEGDLLIEANFSSPQYLRPGWPEVLGGFCFWALILSDQNLISHDQSEFRIKKIHQQYVSNITPKSKAPS